MVALRKYRELKGLTQAKLAAILGVTQGAIAMWENGERKPDILMLKRLSETLECTADNLLEQVADEDTEKE
jgi:transcriptional regulator with XRE-family HTH domain